MKQPKNAGKAPSMQWYPADWRKDTAVQMLSFHDRGVWFELINIMHESAERGVLVINGAPMPEDALSRLLGLDKQTFNQTLSNLLTYGVAKQRDDDGAIYCKRMVEDEKLSQLRRDAGKLGGNPLLLNQKPTTPVKQKPTPSSSTSTSSSNTTKASDAGAPARIQLTEGATADMEEAWNEWQDYRLERSKAKGTQKLAWTERAAKITAKQVSEYIESHGEWVIIDRINSAISGNWQGLNLEKLEAPKKNKSHASAPLFPANRTNSLFP